MPKRAETAAAEANGSANGNGKRAKAEAETWNAGFTEEFTRKAGLAQMLKRGVIMDVVTRALWRRRGIVAARHRGGESERERH